MKRWLSPVAGLIIAAGLQGNLPSSMSLWGAKPDLILVVLIAYALAADPAFGAALGFIAGLIHGCAAGASLGSFIVTRTIVGFLAGFVKTRAFGENPVVPMLSAAWLTLVSEGLFLLANPRPDLLLVMRKTGGECILNALLTLLLYCVMRFFDTRRKIKLVNARL